MTKTLGFLLSVLFTVVIGFAVESNSVIESGPTTGPEQRIEANFDDREIKVNEQYQMQLDALTAQISSATDNETRMELERQAQELKADWELARLQIILEIAVEKGDTRLAAEAHQAIDAIEHPVERTVNDQVRDPETHKQIEGGVR